MRKFLFVILSFLFSLPGFADGTASQKYEQQLNYKKNGCSINIKISKTKFSYFSGTDIIVDCHIPENYELSTFAPNSTNEYLLEVDEKIYNAHITGPADFSTEIKFRPYAYGNMFINGFKFFFKGTNGKFAIETENVPVQVTSLLSSDSQLLDLSMPEFKTRKKILPAILLILLAASVLSAAVVFILRIKKSARSEKEIFWENWERMHEFKDDPKLFYSRLSGIIRNYLSTLSGINFNALPLETAVNWVFESVGKSGQLEHDMLKAVKEWKRIIFKKKHFSENNWRDDLNMVKKMIIRIEHHLQEKAL